MCSIGEDDFGDEGGLHAMEPAPALEIDQLLNLTHGIDLNEICKKCNKNNVIVKLSCKDAQCKECFLMYVRHKFRAALGSTKLVNRGADILIIYDGHEESSVLVDMIEFSLTQETFKKLHVSPKLLIIDMNCLTTTTKLYDNEKRMNFYQMINKLLEKYQFDKFYITIGNKNGIPINFNNLTENDNDNFIIEEKDIVETFNSIKNATSQQDFVQKLKLNLIENCAKTLNCKFIFLSEINCDLAKLLLTNISLGRGNSISQDISFSSSSRQNDIKFIRPIRDLNTMEIKNYIKLTDTKCLTKKLDNINENSIQSLTNKFINDLQINFPSTVTTVFKTGDKIASTNELINTNYCRFCNSALDYKDSTTLFAIEFSRYTSKNAAANDANLKSIDSIENMARNAVNGIGDTASTNLRDLCHGCRNIYRDCNNNCFFDTFL